MWKTVDPDGREVVLTLRRWTHVLDRHPYLGLDPDEIVDAVAHPDRRATGKTDNEEWYYRRGVGPSFWVRVVVHYERGRGLIVTAFPRRDFP